jgi:hypothetical protein
MADTVVGHYGVRDEFPRKNRQMADTVVGHYGVRDEFPRKNR